MNKQKSRRTPVDKEYPTCESVNVSFRIYSQYYPVEEITRIIGTLPTDSGNKGDIKKNNSGRERILKKNFWILSSEGKIASKDARDHFDWLINIVEKKKKEIEILQNMNDVKMTVTCFWISSLGHGGPTLWPEQMHALSELNLECGFEVYF